MGSARPGLAAAVLACGLAASQAALAETFDVPPGPLGQVASTLGAQARATIAIRDPDLASRRSPGVRGRFPLRTAIHLALRGTGARAIFHDGATVQIFRQPLPPPRAAIAKAPIMLDRLDPNEIIVTASKQNIPADRYPGSVKIVEADEPLLAANAAEGTAAIRKLLPSIGSTNLGPGRNKLFIRGIADSSFSGPTQTTTAQYLGDVRLNYNAPDPNLNLADLQRIEVLAGPQGALYGAGTLGGVVRLVPKAPDATAPSATLSASLVRVRHGGFGADGAGVVNLPLVTDKLALRLVAFADESPGYIDAPALRRRDINRTNSHGQRLTLRASDLLGWTLDLGIATQETASQDGQYTLRRDPPLTRNTSMAEPFLATYRLGYITGTRPLGSAQINSTTSLAQHHLKSIFDATGFDGTTDMTRYVETNEITLATHETRVTGGGRRSPWVAGLGVLFSDHTLSIFLRQAALERGGGVSNKQLEAAAFAQMSRPLTATLTGTIGGRLLFASSRRRLLDDPIADFVDPTRKALRFAGLIAADWHPGGRLSAFARYQQGYRAGGIGIALTDASLKVNRFEPDNLQMAEVGIRLGNKARDRFALQGALFLADWRNIQADLIGDFGRPYTTNVGRGVIRGLDIDAMWRPLPNLTLSLSVFLNDSELRVREGLYPETGAIGGDRTLPNVARNGTRGSVTWRKPLTSDLALTAQASIRYVGRSRLGAGPGLDVPQGDYATMDMSGRLAFGRYTLSVGIENVGDTRGNTFSFGSPFGLLQGQQITPLRPRTMKMGLSRTL